MTALTLQRIDTNFSGQYCYTHARGTVTPGGFAIITTQPLRLTGCDVFYGMEMLTSHDRGATWSPIRKSRTLVRRDLGDGITQTFSDATPMYHRKTGKILLLGHDVLYRNDEIMEPPRPRHTLWSVFNPEQDDWEPFREIKMPEPEKYFSCGNGCGQSVELENGELLIPVYYMSREEAMDPWNSQHHAMIMRCSFDGNEIKVLECGNSITVPVPRGLDEPSIIQFHGKYFIALRNDEKGFVTCSDDGLHLAPPEVLVFDDGAESGNYNTQQHWLVCNDKLHLVYTRRGAGNDHIFRHRAPLFIAEFDTVKRCLIRATERIAIPERGARLGNFCCANIAPDEAWIIASEWMQTNPPDPFDWKICASYGSDNSIFIAKVICDEE